MYLFVFVIINCCILLFVCFLWFLGVVEFLVKVVCLDYLNSFLYLLYLFGLVLNFEKYYIRYKKYIFFFL